MSRYNSIIVGAGHNGLVCAAYLAKAGHRVLVVEASDEAGGLAATREFFPGFKVSVAHSISHFSSTVADDLKLSERGFNPDSDLLTTKGLSLSGPPVAVGSDGLSGCSEDDAAAYRRYRNLMDKFAKSLAPFWSRTIPRIGSNSLGEMATFARMGLNLRMLGKQDMREFLRMASLPIRDLMDELFDQNEVKAAVGWDGLVGSKLAPRSPNSAVLALLYRMSELNRGHHWLPTGGIRSLINALESAAVAGGVTMRYSSPVSRIVIDGTEAGLKASGVELESGERLEADQVISGVDPKRTFLDLVGVQNLDIGFTNRIRRLRSEGYVAKLHLALNGLPKFTYLDKPDARMILAPSLDAIEFAFDDAKYGCCSDQPVIEALIPSLWDESLAPAGKHVLSAHVMYVPHQLKGGWSNEARSEAADRAVKTIEQYAPAIREHIVHTEFLSPQDLEHTYRVSGGHWHHGEFAMDQMLMMRPTYGAAQYTTPIPGLYLCSAGCHPGGDLVGSAGCNAARVITS